MAVPASQRVTITLALVCAGLLVLVGCLFWNYAWLMIRVACASEQTQTFEGLRQRALQTDANEAIRHLQYIIQYYPSGTKQETGSQLDRVVERERQRAVNDIIVYMRMKTGQNLGDDPQTWIQKYGQK